MDDLAKFIPSSMVSLIGLAVIMGILVMLGTIFQEWAKSLYRRSIFGGREKRHEVKADYQGIERRAENKELQHALTSMLDAMTENSKQMQDFVTTWKTTHQDIADNIDEIKRKQDKNWKRLFDEELPSVRPG